MRSALAVLGVVLVSGQASATVGPGPTVAYSIDLSRNQVKLAGEVATTVPPRSEPLASCDQALGTEVSLADAKDFGRRCYVVDDKHWMLVSFTKIHYVDSAKKQIVWKREVANGGVPVVMGKRVAIGTVDRKAKKVGIVFLSIATGARLSAVMGPFGDVWGLDKAPSVLAVIDKTHLQLHVRSETVVGP